MSASLRDCMEQARRGDAAAQETLSGEIRRLARACCRNQRSALRESGLEWEDVAQEASRRFFEVGLERYRGEGSVSSYVYSIVKSTSLQLLRGQRRRRSREKIVVAEGPSFRETSGSGLIVNSILRRLEDECRRLIEDVFFHGTSYAQVSRELGITEASVRSKLSRCLGRAREHAE